MCYYFCLLLFLYVLFALSQIPIAWLNLLMGLDAIGHWASSIAHDYLWVGADGRPVSFGDVTTWRPLHFLLWIAMCWWSKYKPQPLSFLLNFDYN